MPAAMVHEFPKLPVDPSSPPPLDAQIITRSDSESISNFMHGLASAFASNPPIASFAAEQYPDTPSPIHRYFSASIPTALDPSAATTTILVEAGHHSALAVWELPTRKKPSAPSLAAYGPVKRDFRAQLACAKQRHIGLLPSAAGLSVAPHSGALRPHYSLELLARNPHVPKVKGAVSAVVTPFLKRAKAEGVKVWLEAASREVIPLYENWGFEVVEELGFGEGGALKIWCMMLEP